MPDVAVGVVGAGTMGAGIAQVALENGHEVVVHDVDASALAAGRERIREGLSRRAAKLGLDADSIDAWVDGRLERLREAETLALLAAEADVVIEAALEDLGLKQEIFRALDSAAEPAAILATNTSALSIAAIASVTSRPERVVGLHFFNPAPLMPLVEVVSGPATAPAVTDRVAALVESWGKTAVRCADSPGFIVNRVNRPFTIEALRMVEAGEATVEAVDEAMRAAGYPMGPFELMDYIGLDVNLATARGIWEGLGRPDRLRPSPIQERLVEAGRLGRKAGEGFYRYAEGHRGEAVAQFATANGTLDREAIADQIVAAIRAEALRARDEGVAAESDIDTALRLGAGHPAGPFEAARAGLG
ncbi:MAG TPA: 3-hydroxyacyl-CoA dehydrogenase NAD-binding domain-containing protein [Candidatus Limnocylindrales bacterium]